MIIIIAIILLFAIIVFSTVNIVSGGFITVGPDVDNTTYAAQLTTITAEVDALATRAGTYYTPLDITQLEKEEPDNKGEWVFMEFANDKQPIKDVNLNDDDVKDAINIQVSSVLKYHARLDDIGLLGSTGVVTSYEFQRIIQYKAKLENLLSRALDNVAICDAISGNKIFNTPPIVPFYTKNDQYINEAVARHEEMVRISNLAMLDEHHTNAKQVSADIADLVNDANTTYKAIKAKADLEGVSNDVAGVMGEAKQRKEDVGVIKTHTDDIVRNINDEIVKAKNAGDDAITAKDDVNAPDVAYTKATSEYTTAKSQSDTHNQSVVDAQTDAQSALADLTTALQDRDDKENTLFMLIGSKEPDYKGRKQSIAVIDTQQSLDARAAVKAARAAYTAAKDLSATKNKRVMTLTDLTPKFTKDESNKLRALRDARTALDVAKRTAEDARKRASKTTIDTRTKVETFMTQIDRLRHNATDIMTQTTDAVKAVDDAIIDAVDTIEEENIMAAMDDDDEEPDTVKYITKIPETNKKAINKVLHTMLMTSGDKINKQPIQPIHQSAIIGNYETSHNINLTKKLAHISDITHIKKIIKVYMNTVNGREPSPKLTQELEIEMNKIIQNPNTQIDASNVIADYATFMKNKINHKHWWLIDVDELRALMNIQ